MPLKSERKEQELTELRRAAEKHLKTVTQAVTVPIPEVTLPRLTHELQVHQIELQMQNDELVESRAEVEAGLKSYTDLYDFSPVSYLTLSVVGTILQLNLAAACLLGAERSRLEGQRLGLYVAEADRLVFAHFLKSVFTSEQNQSCEVTLEIDGKSPRTVQIEANCSGKVNECLIVLIDVTERNQAEAVRLDNEQRLHELEETRAAILDALPAHIALINEQGVVLDVNKSWRQFALDNQLSASASGVGQNYLEICERIGADQCTESHDVAAGIRSVLQNQVESFSIEYPCHYLTEHRWFRLVVTPLIRGTQYGAVLMHVDITDSKKAEEAMQQKLLLAANIHKCHSILSAREKQVMAHLSKGLSSKQIALRLSISTKTIEKHRGRVMQKMKADSLADIVRAAVELGL